MARKRKTARGRTTRGKTARRKTARRKTTRRKTGRKSSGKGASPYNKFVQKGGDCSCGLSGPDAQPGEQHDRSCPLFRSLPHQGAEVADTVLKDKYDTMGWRGWNEVEKRELVAAVNRAWDGGPGQPLYYGLRGKGYNVIFTLKMLEDWLVKQAAKKREETSIFGDIWAAGNPMNWYRQYQAIEKEEYEEAEAAKPPQQRGHRSGGPAWGGAMQARNRLAAREGRRSHYGGLDAGKSYYNTIV
jgi:hypothetical protein